MPSIVSHICIFEIYIIQMLDILSQKPPPSFFLPDTPPSPFSCLASLFVFPPSPPIPDKNDFQSPHRMLYEMAASLKSVSD